MQLMLNIQSVRHVEKLTILVKITISYEQLNIFNDCEIDMCVAHGSQNL